MSSTTLPLSTGDSKPVQVQQEGRGADSSGQKDETTSRPKGVESQAIVGVAAFAEQKKRTDVAQVFLTFMATVGDIDRTALALELDPAFVTWLAEQEGWNEKIRRISVMSKGGKPGDWERAQNRCLNFVQAHRVRMLIDRLILHLFKMTPEELSTKMSSMQKCGGMNLSGRFFADIMSALDKVHVLSYYALGDSVGERLERTREEGADRSVADIHAALIAALNSPEVASQKSTELLMEEARAVVLAEQCERTAQVAESLTTLAKPTE